MNASKESLLPPERGAGEEAVSAAEELLEPNTGGPGGIHAVAGERAIPSVHRARSLQSRLSNMLAIALMLALGLGLLAWYYSRVLTRPTRAREGAQVLARQRAQGDAPLPSLGPISVPVPSAAAARILLAAPPDPKRVSALQALLGPAPPWPGSTPAMAMGSRSTPLAPAHRALDRRLSGPAFASASGQSSGGEGGAVSDQAGASPAPNMTGGPGFMPYRPEPGLAGEGGGGRGAAQDSLASLLTPQVTPAVEARLLPTLRFLLPKGAFIDCTLETAIDSTLPGMTTCVTATDTLSADGTVVLLSRGTKLVGETRGEVEQGQARIFVLWTEARTPTGVVVPLDSPGTDALGRSGLTGRVERHFWERFGAAILVSVIDGAVQAGVQSTSRGGTVLINPSGSEDVMTEVLKGSIDIAPTIAVAQGARIQVLVARDVDFRSVYRLVPVSAAGQGGTP